MMLELKDIEKNYYIRNKKLKVLDNISLTIKENEFVGLIGPSGSGKTTLARIIAGLDRPDKGKVILDEIELQGPSERISMVFQNFALLPWKTALENVELALLNKKEQEREKIASHFLELVGLSGFEDSYPYELSRGMKQRVGLARALAKDPDILILDEPFSALDPLSALSLRRLLKDIIKDESSPPESAILISHNIEEVVELSTRVIVMSQIPAKIKADIKVTLTNKKRNRRSREFKQFVDMFTSLVTS